MVPTKAILLFGFASASIASATDYYLNAELGSDTANGLSETTAWRSLERLNEQALKGGDRILLQAGQVFPGQFYSKNSGSEDKPIRMLSYGEGAKPRIEARGKYQSALVLENVSHWIIEGIEITNTGPEPQAKRGGVLVRADAGGVSRNIILRGLTVRDVNGSISKNKGGGTAIRWEVSNQQKPTRIEGLLIEDCHILRCDRDAIKGWMDPWDDLSNLSTGIIIRGNLLEDIGGDGIVPIGTEGALIEYNRLYGARQRIEGLDTKEVTHYAGPSVGIWPWSSKNTHVRFNEVWNYAGTFDGQGLDSDFNCSGTLFEYNLSAQNAGGFFLICNWSKHQDSGQSIGNSGTIIRHNVSFNDRIRGFVLNGPIDTVSLHGNVIYNTVEDVFQLIVDTPWESGRFAKSVTVTDNVFFTRGEAQIYQGTWGGGGMGLWKAQKKINRQKINFKGNAYTRVAGFDGAQHDEPGKMQLKASETLGSLIGRFDTEPEVRANFDRMHRFLEQSRYWSSLQAAL